jgi:hypothetical protein
VSVGRAHASAARLLAGGRAGAGRSHVATRRGIRDTVGIRQAVSMLVDDWHSILVVVRGDNGRLRQESSEWHVATPSGVRWVFNSCNVHV